jgi:bifunctional non-homologous end joining protein LigD
MQSITLYYKHGSSDKIYAAELKTKDDGYVVNFAYGRRGSALSTGTKTNAPVSLAEAQRIYDRLVTEKTAKGYTPGESGTPYHHTEKAQQVSGILPQLLNPIEVDAGAQLAADPVWCVQEKFDGRRMLIRKHADGIDGINRKGLIVALPGPVAQVASELPGTFVFDGECIGDALVVFDVLEFAGTDYRGLPYRNRIFLLMQVVPGDGPHLRSPETALDAAHKAEFIQRMRREGKEGVVFKKLTGAYLPGRPNTGGDALKLKFVETASFVVAKVNARRSISLKLLNSGEWVGAGNVTIPDNHEIPAEGWVVECQYLYAFPESGAIYQPVYRGVRDDIPQSECVVEQLKYKASPVSA